VTRFAPFCLLFMTLLFSNAALARDAAELGYELTQKELKPGEWEAFLKKVKGNYETWANDTQIGSMKRYLDDKLIEIGPGVLGGNVKSLKKFAQWLALYKEFGEPVPRYVSEAFEKYNAEIEEVMSKFTWELAAERIKNRNKELKKMSEKSGGK